MKKNIYIMGASILFALAIISISIFCREQRLRETGKSIELLGPQRPPYKAKGTIVIIGGLLIDATDAAPRLDQAVVIEGERIKWVGPMKKVKIPEGAEVLDASGMTIMPGLINSNCHINIRALYPSALVSLPLSEIKARWENTWSMMPYQAFVFLMQGVTSIRDTSGPFKRIIPIKNAIEKGDIPGPRIFLGGTLIMSEGHFNYYTTKESPTPPETLDWVRNEFAYHVISDVDKGTDVFLSDDFNYWKLLMSAEPFNGKNDFSDEELRFIINKAHKNGKKIDVHCGDHNDGLRRMTAFDLDTLEHPFYNNFLVDMDIIEKYAKKGVFAATLLTVMITEAQQAADPHRFNESIYAMSLGPKDYPILMQYRDRMLWNKSHPDDPEVAIYGRGRTQQSFNGQQKGIQIAKENMRRFLKGGVKMFMGTDTPSFLNFQQEDPDANEMKYMVEMGMTPMEAIIASTRNGAEALGLLHELGTIEAGKLADIIVVPGNPLLDMSVMKRVCYVVKGGIRYK